MKIKSEKLSREKLRIYNLFPRLAGDMTAWKSHLPRIAAMNFNAVYVNPFHYPGFSGSLYSPSDYYRFNDLFIDANSKLSPVEQLKSFIEEAHGHKLKVIMDLVINHTAIDSPLTKEHPDWYLKDSEGKIKNPGAIHDGKMVLWGDLAEIDNASSKDLDNLYEFWRKLVMYHLDLGFDGFRCDAAYQVPSKLWKFLTGRAKEKYPETLFIAESLGCTIEDAIILAESGFDYTFNSSKYWNYNEPWLIKQYNDSFEKVRGVPSIGFAESHDTPRLFAELGGNMNAIFQRCQFVSFFASGLMVPMGLEFGFKKEMNVVTTMPSDWEDTGTDISDFFKKINDIKQRYRILNEECRLEVVDQPNWMNVFCFRKTSFDSTERILCMVNKDVHNHQFVQFGDINAAIGSAGEVVDISPLYTLPSVNRNFEYNLRPGQLILLYARN